MDENSKFIKFVIDKQELNIFIINIGQILFLIEHFGITKYIILKEGKEVDNTLFSLDYDSIKKVDNYLKEDEFEKANKTLDDSNVLLQSLSILYNKYQKYDTILDKFHLTEERKEFFQKLKDLLRKTNFVSICGPKSIGKTTSLLYFKKTYIPSAFYINLSYCKKLFESKNTEELYLTICKELFSCLKFEEVNNVYSFLEKKNYNSLMDLIYNLINYISDNFKKVFYFIIIDQYKEKIDNDNTVIEQIKNNLSNKSNMLLIICNSLNEKDYRKALHLYKTNPNKFFLNYLFINKLVTISKDDEAQLKDEEKNSYFQNVVIYFNIFIK